MNTYEVKIGIYGRTYNIKVRASDEVNATAIGMRKCIQRVFDDITVEVNRL